MATTRPTAILYWVAGGQGGPARCDQPDIAARRAADQDLALRAELPATSGLAKGAYLGPLVGAQAELGEPTRHRRVGAAVGTTLLTGGALGVLGFAPMLSKKSKALAFVVFSNGTVHERPLDGNMAIRSAQSEAVRFNAMARAEAAEPVAATKQPDDSRDLRHLALGRFSPDEQFLIWRATRAFDQDDAVIDASCGRLTGFSNAAAITPCRAALVIGEGKIVIFCDRSAGYRRYERGYTELSIAESTDAGLTLTADDDRLELSELPDGSAQRLATRIAEMTASAAAVLGPEARVVDRQQAREPGVFSVADEIRKFAELHAAGILTDSEFAAKKKQLLELPFGSAGHADR